MRRPLSKKSFSQARADAFDRKECARLYTLATGTEGRNALIKDAVARYVTERVLQL